MPNLTSSPAPSDNQSILAYLLSQFTDDYFGVFILAVQHGKIINVRKEQNLKTAEILARNSGKPYAPSNIR
jgi:hypothetical protein